MCHFRAEMVYVLIGFYMIYRYLQFIQTKVCFQFLLMLNVSYDVIQIVISAY